MPARNLYPLLETIDSPEQVRSLTQEQLCTLADELRGFLIRSVSETGGHLAASLGTVELTVALHHVFDTPHDRLVWDVGHQGYAHKILTGRRERMPSLRKLGGLSGFPKRDESEYDAFGTGHSSTSISAALGMATAASLQNIGRKTIAVIGDGAMTAGQAFEALNHAGDVDANLLVILNDNDMSISPNVGALNNYLARVLSGSAYTRMRESGKQILKNMPPVRELAKRAEEHMKGMVTPGTLFEELGFNYIGPVDGHDLRALVKTLRNIHALKGPQLLHIVTQKGKGFAPAENSPCEYHGVGRFDPLTGKKPAAKATGPTFTEVFGQWLIDRAGDDPRLVAITPAMSEGSGLVEFAEKFPDRCIDVGIAEQHSVTLAAGLACDGMHPVVAIYSTFLQRAYDQLIHDVAIQNLPVTFAIDRAGLVGADGPTHAGSFDLTYLRCVPNLTIMAPADENECRQMLELAHRLPVPAAVRYPRGRGAGITVDKDAAELPYGKAARVRDGKDVAVLAFGTLLYPALEAARSLNATVINMRFVKPLDDAMLAEIATGHELLVTVEENSIHGGAGSGVNEWLAAHGFSLPVLNLGLPDSFVEQGERDQLLSLCGLDAEGIKNAVRAHLEVSPTGAAHRLIS